jgi:hypothetical protein
MLDVHELPPLYLSIFNVVISPYLDVFEALPSLSSPSPLP